MRTRCVLSWCDRGHRRKTPESANPESPFGVKRVPPGYIRFIRRGARETGAKLDSSSIVGAAGADDPRTSRCPGGADSSGQKATTNPSRLTDAIKRNATRIGARLAQDALRS
jgi:hypothetical protein